MKRYPLSYRAQMYNEADFYKLTPIARKLVAPGESLTSVVIDARFISAVFPKVVTTPVLAQCWLFYVPHRLVWDQWVDFIALSDTVSTIPSVALAWASMFEHGSANKSCLYRRSYKAVYNQYFGDESVGQANGAWYDDIAADTYAILNRLLAWDQQKSRGAARAGYTQQSFSATVTGAVAAIPLDDFARSLRNNTARRRQRQTGDKYVDTMRMMGVELDWRIQMAPEYLCSSQTVILPRERSSAGTDLTQRVSEWSGRLVMNSSKRYAFAEHGFLVGVCGFRPAYMIANQNAYDAVDLAQTNYYRPDADTVMETGSSVNRERYQPYIAGQNSVGTNDNGNAFVAPDTAVPFYPDSAYYTVAASSGPRHMAMTADVSVKGLTPVPSQRA